uniref:Putative ovule protein n=1 Tax=Solanum chacoense TaxID=4108 RepID=A0A0V0HDA1_SOLCH
MINEIETNFSFIFFHPYCLHLSSKDHNKKVEINWVISTYCQSNLSCQIFPKLNRRLVLGEFSTK